MEEIIRLQLIILGKTFIAMVLGAIIGIDREKARKPAGLRTHIFVAGASALFAGMAVPLVGAFQSDTFGNVLQSDPIRIIEACITGVAFLGAGTIIKSNDNTIQGLTTAASLLLTSAIGIAVAINLYILSIGGTLISFFVLCVLGRWERKII